MGYTAQSLKIKVAKKGLYCQHNSSLLVILYCLLFLDARRVFPCHDTPNRKAVFKTSLVVYSKDMEAISNMKATSTKFLADKRIVTFAKTPKMSTYLFAIAIGDFKRNSFFATKDIKVNVYLPIDTDYFEGLFAAKIAEKVLNYFETYFNANYPLPKLDLVAIPDFAPGAMENWGLITFRTSALLRKPTTQLEASKRVGYVVAHEIAHQWFGNLVTMNWWSDLWLNEGFATFMGSKALHELFPFWDYWTHFINSETEKALHLDSLSKSHPIFVDVKNVNELGEIFDAISYSKGGSLIQMLNKVIGDISFQGGLVLYMQKFAYNNTDSKDLFGCWDELSPKFNVTDFMTFWITNKGYPYISASVSENNNHEFDLTIEQKHFSFVDNDKTSDTVWPIPLFPLLKNKRRNPLNKKILKQKDLTVRLTQDEFDNFIKVDFLYHIYILIV